MIEKIKYVDQSILLWVHNKLSNPILDKVIPFLTEEDNWILPILFLILFLSTIGKKKGRISLILIFITLGLTDFFCAQYIKPFIERVRPSHLNLDGLHLLVHKGGKWSMPSNHAANMYGLAVILSYFYNRYKRTLFSLAFIIAFSRVYVGVHYPGDVIVGGLIGYTLGWIVLTGWAKIKIRELKKGRTWVWYGTTSPIFKF